MWSKKRFWGSPLLARTDYFQKNPRVRKIRVRNSGAGNDCANFMDTWKKCILSAGKPMSIKFRVLGRVFLGGGILFLWARGFFWYLLAPSLVDIWGKSKNSGLLQGAHQEGHATARFLEGFLEGSLKEVLLRRVLRRHLVRILVGAGVRRRVLRRGAVIEGA